MASVGIRVVQTAFGTTRLIHGVDIFMSGGEFVMSIRPSGCDNSMLRAHR
jgi:ABC-type nitrate/sulfonate/bicarbonate transport system ATPase subunit